MRKSILCAFLAVIENVEVRKSKNGQDFLHMTVTRIDDEEKIYATVWSGVEDLVAVVKPKQTVHMVGTIKLLRWTKANVEHSALMVTAEKVDILFDIDARPKSKLRGNNEQSKLDFTSGPASQRDSKKYDRPFDDDMPF